VSESERPDPRPDDDPAEGTQGAPSGEPTPEHGAKAKPERKPWPKVDPSALQTKKFMTAHDITGGQVAVTASDGEVLKEGTPSGLFSRLVEEVGGAIKRVGNMVHPPLVVGARAGASMTIVFGDPIPDEVQTEIRVYPTWQAAQRIAQMMELDDEQLLIESATRLGAGTAGYVELAELVQAEGISLKWEVLGFPLRTLNVTRAAWQYEQLTRPVEMRKREMMIEGLLYRVIYDGPTQGRAGIKLAPHSPKPLRRRGQVVIVSYDARDVEDLIIHQLIGKSVMATVEVEEPAGTVNLPAGSVPFPVVRKIREGQSFETLEFSDLPLEDDDDFSA
jgi:hypothetical protein